MIRKIKSLIKRLTTMMKRRLASLSAARQLRALTATTDIPFFVIIMPGSLHILKTFMRYAPETISSVLILNGVNQWERDWLMRNLPRSRTITLSATISHGKVMDLIIDNFRKPFGLIDSDCFVFKPDYFRKAQALQEDTLLNAFFSLQNEEIGLEIPQTYFLFFNPVLISTIKKKYHVNCDQYQFRGLPKKIKGRLSEIGIDEVHMPESFKKLFDTLRLIIVLGLADGYKINFIEKIPAFSQPNSEMFHVGAVYFNNNIRRLSLMRGSYFWRRCLEKCEDVGLIEYYYSNYGNQTSEEILNSNHEFASYSSTKTYVEFVEKILDRKIVDNQVVEE